MNPQKRTSTKSHSSQRKKPLLYIAQLGDLIDGQNNKLKGESDRTVSLAIQELQRVAPLCPSINLIGNHELYNFNRKQLTKENWLQYGDKEYYIHFSEDTVRKASQLFLSRGKQNNSTLEHEVELGGLSVVESWIIEDEIQDKSRKYNLNMPVGTWMVSVKVNNDEIWEEFIKTEKVKGFSIEGFFSDKNQNGPKESVEEELSPEDLAKIYDIEEILSAYNNVELKTYSDYPKAARNNAKRALKWKKENGSSCGTSVGWTRAAQLARGASLSRSTIARMASFKRHQQHKDVPYSEGCGGLMWDAWGGSAGVNWAISKLKKIDNEG